MRFYPLGGGRIKECVLLPGGKISFSEIDLGVKEILLPGGKISFSEIDVQRNALFDPTPPFTGLDGVS